MENNNHIGDLRRHLFAQLDRLSDDGCNLEKELKRADAIVSVGRVIVESAKAETDFMKVVGAKQGTGFIGIEPPATDEAKQLGTGKH